MKFLTLTFLFLFSLVSVSALTITAPTTIDQGSTAIFTLQGNILDPITKSDAGFFQKHVQVPFDYDVKKIEGTYYIYAIMPYQSKNYSLRIFDVYFKENNEFQTRDLEVNFSTSNNVAEFNVKPGFIITSQNSSKIDIYNNLNSDLPITYTIGEIQKQKTLPLQETTKITIDLKHINGTALNTLTISSPNSQFQMPVYTIRQNFGEPEQTPEPGTEPEIDEEENIIEPIIIPEGSNLQFSRDLFDETLKTNEVRELSFLLKNSGDRPSGRIDLKISEEIEELVEIDTISISNLDPNQEVNLRILITASKSGEFKGGILAQSQNSIDELELSLLIGESLQPSTSVKTETTCLDLNGEVCLASQKCTGTNVPIKDGLCCTAGECTTNFTPKNKGKGGLDMVSIILVVVAVLIILAAVFFKIKSKRKDEGGITARMEPPPKRPSPSSLMPKERFPAKNYTAK